MTKKIEALLGVVVVTVLGAGLNTVAGRAADAAASQREKLRAARPERPGKAGDPNHSETKELRKILEEKRKTLPKSPEVLQSEQRAIVRENLARNAAVTNRAAAMNKAAKKNRRATRVSRRGS